MWLNCLVLWVLSDSECVVKRIWEIVWLQLLVCQRVQCLGGDVGVVCNGKMGKICRIVSRIRQYGRFERFSCRMLCFDWVSVCCCGVYTGFVQRVVNCWDLLLSGCCARLSGCCVWAASWICQRAGLCSVVTWALRVVCGSGCWFVGRCCCGLRRDCAVGLWWCRACDVIWKIMTGCGRL